MIKYEKLCDYCGDKLDHGVVTSDECGAIHVGRIFCDGICNGNWLKIFSDLGTLGVLLPEERKGDKK